MSLDYPSSQQNNSVNKKKKSFSFSSIFKFKKKTKKKHQEERGQDYEGLDKKLLYSLSPKKIPDFKQIKYIKKVLPERERKWFNYLLIIVIAAGIVWVFSFLKKNIIIHPKAGGEYYEGLVGFPKNINPLYSMARDVDNDISRLVFSSLFERDVFGNISSDLVENYSVSEDGLEYIFKIKEGVKWHNGENLSVADIIFTFETIKNPDFASPLRNSLGGLSIEQIDDYSFKVILKESYSDFLELLTFDILPRNLWENIPSSNAFLHELNIKPIGSGPYKFKSLTKNKNGEIKEMSLVLNTNYYREPPYISKIILKFYNNYNEMISALNNNQIKGISYLPYNLKSDLASQNSLNFNKLNLPQITSLFFNSKNNGFLESKDFRKNLARLIDRNRINNEVFSGNVSIANGPILPSSPAFNAEIEGLSYDLEMVNNSLNEEWLLLELNSEELELLEELKFWEEEKNKEENDEPRQEEINNTLNEKNNLLEELTDFEAKKEILDKFPLEGECLLGKWRYKKSKQSDKKYDFLKIELTTVDSLDNITVAEFIKEFWSLAGIRTDIKIINSNQIQSEIIKEKNFEALLLSQVIASDQDNYAFWHSSQISESGLNISSYKNKEVDKLLEEARTLLDPEERFEKYRRFQELLNNDFPAIFLYFPSYSYVQSKKIKGFDSQSILNPADRFNNISHWYIKTSKKIKFKKK